MATLIAVQRKEPIERPIKSITIELSIEEAQTILDVSHRIGGPPADAVKPSRRQYMDSVAQTLLGAGVKSLTHDDYTGQMYFTATGEKGNG